MVTIQKVERGNTAKISWNTQSSDVDTDVTNPTVTVYKSDGTKLVDAETPTHDSTGNYTHYMTPAITDPLGLYIVVWSATHPLAGTSRDILDRKYVNVVEAEQ